MRYKCSECGNVHRAVLDNCPQCKKAFYPLTDRITDSPEGFRELKARIIKYLSDYLMVGETRDVLTISIKYESRDQLQAEYRKVLEQVGTVVDSYSVTFLDRCLYYAEWVLEYAVLHFSYEGKGKLGTGSTGERLDRAMGFDE